MRGKSAAAEHGERIARLREDKGWTYRRIAENVGISDGAVRWYCLKEGIEPPKRPMTAVEGRTAGPAVRMRRGRPVRLYTPEEDALILRRAAEGKTYVDIGRETGRRHNSIMCRLAILARHDARREEAATSGSAS